MSEAIIVALITGGVGLIGTIITVLTSNRKTLTTLDKQSELSDQKIHGEIDVIKTEIKTLSDRVDRHNQMIDRVYSLEQKTAVQEQQISDLEKRAG